MADTWFPVLLAFLSSPGSAVRASSCKTSEALVGGVELSALITNHRPVLLLLLGVKAGVGEGRGVVWATDQLSLSSMYAIPDQESRATDVRFLNRP